MENLALFSTDGLLFVLRWLHVLFGITWIGLLYYFNFVQGAFFAETDAATKSGAIQKLLPRALWWFRWAAMFTLFTGLALIAIYGQQGGIGMFATSWGIQILLAMSMAVLMWFNVWFVIWPNQQIVIQSATQAAAGGAALPTAAAAGSRALVASRTNTLFSIPMLFFMSGSRHLTYTVNPNANLWILTAVLAVIILALEFNALKGKTGPMTKIVGVIHCGLGLTVVFYGIVEFLTK